jgi:hypothetical protein
MPGSRLSAGISSARGTKAETMSPQSDLRVEVVDDEIIVTLPQSHYSATYYKPEKAPKLLAKNLPDRDDPRATMSVSEFLDKAWKLAKNKARELGWDWSE